MTTPAPTLSPLRLDRLIGWAVRHAWRRWPLVVGVAGLMLGRVGLEVLKPWPMAILVDHVLQGRPLPGWLQGGPWPATAEGWMALCVGGTLLLFLSLWVVNVVHGFLYVSLGQRMTFDLASDLLARLQQVSLGWHTRRGVGDTTRRVMGDSGCLSTIVNDALLPVSSAVVSLVVMFVVLWRLHPGMTLLALGVVPFMAWGFRRYAGPMMEHSYAQQEAEGRIYEEVEQTFTTLPMVQAFGLEADQEQRYRSANGNCLAATLDLTRVQVWFKVWIGLASALGAAVVVWLGSRAAMTGEFSVGSMILFLSYLGSLYTPLETIMYTSSTVQGAMGSARRVREILEDAPALADRPRARALQVTRGEVTVENVTVGYTAGRPVLRDAFLKVGPGEMVALVGATGAGKSTLASLLPRFLDPWQGRVLIDGQDLREVRLASVRRQVGLVLQEPFLFPLSIADNLAYGKPGATPEEIETAARLARAHDFIARLSRGYETVLGDRGVTLSGGERQRLSIARALLKNAPILVLDEPTSALDADTEHAFLEALDHFVRDHTVLLIAHRLSTVRRATRVVFLENGRIAEMGTVAELREQKGRFAEWCRLQESPPPPPTSSPASSHGIT